MKVIRNFSNFPGLVIMSTFRCERMGEYDSNTSIYSISYIITPEIEDHMMNTGQDNPLDQIFSSMIFRYS